MLTAASVAIATTLAAPVLAAPAHADDAVNAAFLAALGNAGIGYGNPTDTVALGQSICPMLVEPGKNFAKVAQTVRGGNNGGISPDMAAFFTGIAITMYCPQMVASIGDGTVLNQLSNLNGLAGLGGGFGGAGGPGGLSGLDGLGVLS